MVRLLPYPSGLLPRPLGGLRHQVGSYGRRVTNLFGSSLIGYWKLDEISGTTALDSSLQGNDGAYAGVSLANTALPPAIGGKAPRFDGANGVVNVYSAALNSNFNGAAGTVLIWARVSGSGVYEDGTQRNTFRFLVDASNYVQIYKRGGSNDNRFGFEYVAGGTAISILPAVFSLTTGWVCYGITWNKAADEVRAWRNGAQVLTTQSGLGTWSGNLMNSQCVIGASSTGLTTPWDGWLGHVILLNGAAAAAQIANVYSWGV